MSTMYDGLNTDAQVISKIIKPGDKVAYYVDGLFAWTPAEIALFPHNDHITITVFGNPADVADCESGDMTPNAAADWVRRRRAAGYFRPTVYRSLSGMPDLRQATGNLIMGQDWDSWVADFDNSTSSVYPGSAAKQYRSLDDRDVSEIYDAAWPHRVLSQSTAPVTAPKWMSGVVLQKSSRGHAVQALQKALSGSGIYGVRGILVDGIFGDQTTTSVRNYQAHAGIPVDGIAGAQTRSALISDGFLNSAGQATT